MALSIVSGGERLLHVSDAVLYPLHLEFPEWTPVFDMLPAQASASKRRIFDLAAEENDWSSPTISLPSPTWGMSAKKVRDGTGNRSRHRSSRHNPLTVCEARVYLEVCPLGPQDCRRNVWLSLRERTASGRMRQAARL
jgi:glyoxylase-like metal-dependent hydrolase (beta-lactamase superfamily II)